MALAGKCMTKADICPNCGKNMGFFAGLRGFGMRQKGHADRCKRRCKATEESAPTVHADVADPLLAGQPCSVTPVGEKELPAPLNQAQLSSDAFEEEPSTTALPEVKASEPSREFSACNATRQPLMLPITPRNHQVAGNAHEEYPCAEAAAGDSNVRREPTAPLYHVQSASDVRALETPAVTSASDIALEVTQEPCGFHEASTTATETIQHALEEQRCLQGNTIMESTSPLDQTKQAPESSVATPEEIASPETTEGASACHEARQVNDVVEPEPPSTCSYPQRNEGSSHAKSFSTADLMGGASQKSNNRKERSRKERQNSQQKKWRPKVQQ